MSEGGSKIDLAVFDHIMGGGDPSELDAAVAHLGDELDRILGPEPEGPRMKSAELEIVETWHEGPDYEIDDEGRPCLVCPAVWLSRCELVVVWRVESGAEVTERHGLGTFVHDRDGRPHVGRRDVAEAISAALD
jgi:hypothetical protein